MVKELLEKHFNSQNNILLSSLPSNSDIVQSDEPLGSRNKQSGTEVTDDNVSIYSCMQRDSAKNQDQIDQEKTTGKVNARASTHQPPERQNANLYFTAVDPSPTIFSKTVDTKAILHDSIIKTDQ